MRFVRALVASAPFTAMLLLASGALAQSSGQDAATAQALVDDGKRLMGLGKYAEACPKLVESQRLDPGGGTRLAIALCHEAEGKTATAWADFNLVLTEARRDRRADRETAATEHIRALDKKMARMTLSVASPVEGLEVRRDGFVVGRAQWSTPLPIDPGEHQFDARAPGYKTWEGTVVIRGEGASVDVHVPALEAAPATASQAAAPTSTTPETPRAAGKSATESAATGSALTQAEADDASARRTHLTWAAVTGGVGLVATGGQRIGGRYVVERILGQGGMGVVAAGKYPELGQEVAIKFLLPELAENTVLSARFLREARLAGRVKSPHFVRVFDLGKLDSGVPFLVMELLSGRDLGAEIEQRGPLPIEVAVDYLLQALVGIAEIHALGIIHRDLKPSNLFVSEAAGTRTIKVLDFGISKESGPVSSNLTATDNLIGTPHYMSPEQVKESRTVDESSDVWSLGVILYELLTGSLPFQTESGGVGELFGMTLFTDPDPPTKHRPDLPPALEAVILKCLRRERPARYQDVLELAEALGPFAPAAAEHRVDAVKQAFLTSGPERIAERAAVRAASSQANVPALKVGGNAVPTMQANGPAVTTPSAVSGAAPQEAARPIPRPVSAISGDSVATSMTSSRATNDPATRPSRRALPFVLAGVASVIVGAAMFVAMNTNKSAEVGPASSTPQSTATARTAPTTSPTSASAAATMTVAPLEPTSVASAASSVGSASKATTPTAVVSQGKQHSAIHASTSTPASTSAPASTSTSTNPAAVRATPSSRAAASGTAPIDLLLDRK